MAYRVPSLDGMHQLLISLFKSVFPDRNVGSRATWAWKILRVIAAAITDVHAHVDAGLKDVMPDTARGAGLDRWIGIFAPGGAKRRKTATPARKAAAGRVRGNAGASTTVGDQLLHRASGLLFAVNSTATIPESQVVDVDIVAVSTGAATRLKRGEVLEYRSPPVGVQRNIVLQRDLDDDGVDVEQEGSARNRLLDALATPSAGGNQSDLVGWALSQIGISAAYVYPNRAGVGTLDVAALHAGAGAARVLNAGENAALLARLQTLVPAQLAANGGALRVLNVIGGNVDSVNLANVEVTLVPNGSPQYAFDWDDTTPCVVSSWTASTRTLRFSSPRPVTMQAGHRVCIRGVATSQDGAPLVIEALVGTDAIILQTAPSTAPAVLDVVHAGGPLTESVRAAIVAHLNGDVVYAGPSGPIPGAFAASASTSTVELKELAAGVGTANPGGRFGAWPGGLMRSTVLKIATYTRGVRAAAVITPTTDQEAVDYAFPVDHQIGLLTPGFVLVRRG